MLPDPNQPDPAPWTLPSPQVGAGHHPGRHPGSAPDPTRRKARIIYVLLGAFTVPLLLASIGLALLAHVGSCVNLMIGYSTGGPPSIDELQGIRTIMVLAYLLGVGAPAVAAITAIRRRDRGTAAGFVAIGLIVTLGYARPIWDLSRAIATGDPASYCVMSSYSGG